MFLNRKVFRFFVIFREVFVVFYMEFMKDLRQAKRHISALGVGWNGVLWENNVLGNNIVRSTRMPLNFRGFRQKVLIKIICIG